MSEDRNIYELLWKALKWLLERIFNILVLFIRLTIYWIVKLIYKIFNLREIDIQRQRNIYENLDDNVTYKHEFCFPKSEEFLTSWIFIQDVISSWELDKDDEREFYDFILSLIAESERNAFNVTYEYLRTKDMKEPSFQDMAIQEIFKSNSDVEPRAKVENPLRQKEGIKLHYKREREKNNKVDEAKARGIF